MIGARLERWMNGDSGQLSRDACFEIRLGQMQGDRVYTVQVSLQSIPMTLRKADIAGLR